MCLATIIGTVLSIATNILVGGWGIVMLVVGTMMMTTPKTVFKSLSDLHELGDLEHLIDIKVAFSSQAVILIIIGLAVIAVSVFGLCCGQCGKLCRLVYIIGLGAVVAVVFLLLLVLTTPVGTSLVKEDVEEGMQATFEKYLKDPETVDGSGSIILPSKKAGGKSSSELWFKYQSLEQCCGVKGKLAEFNATKPFPPSCCQLITQNTIPTKSIEYSNYDSCMRDSPKYVNLQGCSDKVVASLLMAPQLAEIALLIALLLVIASLTCAAFLLGD